MEALVILSRLKGFESRDNLIKVNRSYYYLWLCELQKWLREIHFINVEVTLNFTFDELDCHYNVSIQSKIQKNDTNTWHGFDCTTTYYAKYEQALEAGLVDALSLI